MLLQSPGLDAVIFDLDGTLVDTLDDIADAMNFALSARGLPTYDREDYRRRIGEGVEHLTQSVLPDHAHAHALVPEIVAAYRYRYDAHLLDRSLPYAGVVELLSKLAARRLPLSVLSNKPDAATQRLVRELFPRVPFVAVLGDRQGTPRKPDPSSALELALRMQVEPSRCALVGDTHIDMQTAVAAGMLPLGVRWGFQSADELLAHGAKALLDRPLALLDFLD